MLDTTLSSSTSKSSVKDPKANVIKEEPEAEKKEETTTDVVANGAPEGKIFFFAQENPIIAICMMLVGLAP